MKWCPGWVVAVKVGEVELAGLGIDRNLGVGEEARLTPRFLVWAKAGVPCTVKGNIQAVST